MPVSRRTFLEAGAAGAMSLASHAVVPAFAQSSDWVLEKKGADTPFGKIAYVDWGQGPIALFVHGVFVNSYLWRYVIERVADLRRCLAIDLLSHGDSPARADQDVSFRAQAGMLEAFCQSLGIDRIDLVANDSGGAIAQIFAARHPNRIRSLVLTNCDVHDNYPPPAFAPTRAAAKAGRFSARREELLADIELSRPAFANAYEHVDRVSAETLRAYLGPLLATPQATHNLERWLVASGDNTQTTEIEPLLRRLEAPTAIVWGTGDVFFPLRWAYWLKDAIPGAKKVVEVQEAKLFFPEERPDALASALREHWRA
jgi:pimeloyl-ACP methyl ester carboxylesterase